MSQRAKKYTLVQVPTWFVWAVLVLASISNVRTAVVWFYGDQSPADIQCREIVKGAIGIETHDGIICVRPVHFIRRGAA